MFVKCRDEAFVIVCEFVWSNIHCHISMVPPTDLDQLYSAQNQNIFVCGIFLFVKQKKPQCC